MVVAAFASWHECHHAARRVLDGGIRLIGHCALETYSVLTRLPPPHRSAPAIVRDFLIARFPEPYLQLGEKAHREFIRALPEHDIAGGGAYDALVAATAASHDAELATCDRRALPTYERYGVKLKLIVESG